LVVVPPPDVVVGIGAPPPPPEWPLPPLPLPPEEECVVVGGAELVAGGGVELVVAGATAVVVVGATAAGVVVGVTVAEVVVVALCFGFALCGFFFFFLVFLAVVVVVDGVEAAVVELELELLDPQPATTRAAAIAVISSSRFMVRAPLFARRLSGLRVQEASGEITRVELLSCGRGLPRGGGRQRVLYNRRVLNADAARRDPRRDGRPTGE
jgi:hypothetical protein